MRSWIGAITSFGLVVMMQVLTTAARCNNATVGPVGNDADSWQVIGDPTEGALVVAALKAGECDLAVAFARFCLPHIFFYGVYTMLSQVLNSRGRFGAPMFAPIVLSRTPSPKPNTAPPVSVSASPEKSNVTSRA